MMKSHVQKSQVPISSPTFVKHTKTIEPSNKLSLHADPSLRPQQLVSSKPPQNESLPEIESVPSYD